MDRRVAFRCPGCGRPLSRVAEVGDCWLDAGIVPFSTLPYLKDRAAWARWFPADLVVEMAAQIRTWFSALLFMSVALEDHAPYRVVVAHDRVLAEDGREMHKSWGNAVWLDEALDRLGLDAVRYLFAAHPMADPIRVGERAAREVTRRFLTLWNVVGLFVTYANLDRPALAADAAEPRDVAGLEAWVLSRLHATICKVRGALDGSQLRRALGAIEDLVQEDEYCRTRPRSSRIPLPWEAPRRAGSGGERSCTGPYGLPTTSNLLCGSSRRRTGAASSTPPWASCARACRSRRS